jgi:dethiobiotin synthetase
VRFFVTGVDTDVGKSVTTGCLAAGARAWGTVLAAKPVASGVPSGEAGDDAERIALGAGHAPLFHTRLVTPVSPHRAAMLEGTQIGHDVLDWVRDQRADTVLIEGAGGWRVPLGGGLWMRDLAVATGGPCIVVAADRIGVLNHTLLTVQAIQSDGLQVLGVVLNQGLSAPGDPSVRSNLDDLRDLLDVPIAPLPRVTDAPAGPPQWEDVGKALWHTLGVIRSAP